MASGVARDADVALFMPRCSSRGPPLCHFLRQVSCGSMRKCGERQASAALSRRCRRQPPTTTTSSWHTCATVEKPCSRPGGPLYTIQPQRNALAGKGKLVMAHPSPPLILLTGATGYIGGRLLKALERQAYRLRCLARRPDFLGPRVAPTTEIVPRGCARSSEPHGRHA